MKKHSVPLVLAALAALPGCSQRDENASGAGSENASDAPPAALGARLYDVNCAACHQQDGRGIPGVYPTMAGSPLVLGDPKDLALWVLKGRRTASMPEGRYPTKMQAFDWMKPAAAAALFTYLRSSFDNAAPAVDASAVAKALESP
jgi:mono/diheme cytochrome c family protein